MSTNSAARKQKTANMPVVWPGLYQAAFENATDAMIILDIQGNMIEVNDAAIKLTGYSRKELAGSSLSVLTASVPTPRTKELPSFGDLVEARGTYEDVAIGTANGDTMVIDLSVQCSEKNYCVLAFRDVTPRKQLEVELFNKHRELTASLKELERKNTELEATQQMLVQAGKMAALGELSAGIAHEINQPLQAIRGYAQELESVHGKSDSLKEIIMGADKMARIIQQLRTFTRKSSEGFEQISVEQPIEEAFKLISGQLAAKKIKIERTFATGLPKVYVNALQLEQVFINLASNARDAIDETKRGYGTIKVETRKISDQMIEVIFKDDGIGMTEATKRKVFNPFFTTKEVGKGMGLGMSLSYGMISKIQGSIVVESEYGKGTEFRIRIPKDFRELA